MNIIDVRVCACVIYYYRVAGAQIIFCCTGPRLARKRDVALAAAGDDCMANQHTYVPPGARFAARGVLTSDSVFSFSTNHARQARIAEQQPASRTNWLAIVGRPVAIG